MNDKAVITCALTGVLTDPKQHHVPVTPDEMSREAKAAFEAGAAVMHVHFRQQDPGKGHLPSWDPELAVTIMQAIRDACPGVILNETTGTMGPNISGPLACLRAVKPEIAACNAGSLNYLKVRADAPMTKLYFGRPLNMPFLAYMPTQRTMPTSKHSNSGCVPVSCITSR